MERLGSSAPTAKSRRWGWTATAMTELSKTGTSRTTVRVFRFHIKTRPSSEPEIMCISIPPSSEVIETKLGTRQYLLLTWPVYDLTAFPVCRLHSRMVSSKVGVKRYFPLGENLIADLPQNIIIIILGGWRDCLTRGDYHHRRWS